MGTAASNENDPRVKRTRQLLLEALVELAAEQNLRDITVRKITERASVNRATFYAHFEDKSALIEAAMRDAIQQALFKKLQASCPFNRSNLRLLIQTVAEVLRSALSQCRGPNRESHPLVEATVQGELYAFILSWLQQAFSGEKMQGVSVETLATILSWAIFGASLQWSRNPNGYSTEYMAEQIMPLLLSSICFAIQTPLLD
ncbi:MULTISPECIES: TetR/AcrR family transcriptional regulator [Nostocales]|uniref:TetR/AcrR family transcriptional regulator n=3 Tax=Nostocales TaxID=1161 RepID=A0A0C1NC86_9CYAN|nr:TetR/AcrR family transcriptional regulator [Tolypothrix bouteillei]KAF3890284.1 TetR/AcrR family transcriptional regulator [Tolypothrix bouteillei VB521301]